MIWSLMFSLLLGLGQRDAASQPANGTAVIAGVVTTGDALNVTPLRRAIVSLSGTGIIGTRQVASDDDGRFQFDRLPPGRFTLVADKAGWLTTYVGSPRPGRPPSTPFVVTDGQRIVDLKVHVLRGAAIEGTLRDELGRPVAGAQVSAWLPQTTLGQTQFVAAAGRASRVLTDDRGRYRLWGLLPGTYVVEASGGSSLATGAELLSADGMTVRLVTRAPVYAPGAMRAIDAMQISVGAGEERAGVDIVNPLVPSSKLALRVIGDEGQPLQSVSIGVASLTLGRVTYSPGFVRPDAEGRFMMPSLVPGRYLFYGNGRVPPAGPLWLRTEVEVGAADADATLSLKRGQRVSGRLTADDAPPAWPSAVLKLVALPEIAGTALPLGEARPAEDGTFEFSDVPPGRYALEVSVPGGWRLESALREGKDILDVLLDVAEGSDVAGIAARVSRRSTRVSGLVVDSLGRPSPEFSVVVFPADSDLRRTAARRTSGLIKIGSDGRFAIEHLPPGDYLLAVVVDGDPDQLKDSGFLNLVAQGAIPIRLTPGATIEQTLKIGGS